MQYPVYTKLSMHLEVLQAMLDITNDVETVEVLTKKDEIRDFVRNFMPNGLGFENGTEIDLERSKPEKLVFKTSFHHKNGYGYKGWTKHQVIVTPTLGPSAISIMVTGKDKNHVKDLISLSFHQALHSKRTGE